jgi:methionyl aminopeptidase
MLKENVGIFDLVEKIEKKILDLGGKIAFPVNISINENAAHYTPDLNDTIVLKENDLVKVDIGVDVEGYIWDRAFTVCIGKETHPLIEASEKALQEALKIIKPGVKIFEISEVVENTITEFGFNPVRNLCGHGLEQYVQHTSPTIPNGKNTIKEVFSTNGVGLVKESAPVLIYKFMEEKPVRLFEARKILQKSRDEFEMLPFAKRWLTDVATGAKLDLALRQLVQIGALTEYPVLKEESNGLVAQTEETVIVK